MSVLRIKYLNSQTIENMGARSLIFNRYRILVFTMLLLSLKVSDAEINSINLANIGSAVFNPNNWEISKNNAFAISAFPTGASFQGKPRACIIRLKLSQPERTHSLTPTFDFIPAPKNTKRVVATYSNSSVDGVFFIGKDFLQYNTISQHFDSKISYRIEKGGRYADLNFLDCSPKRFGNKILIAFGGKSITTIATTINRGDENVDEFRFDKESPSIWKPDIVSLDSNYPIIATNCITQKEGVLFFESALVKMTNAGSGKLIYKSKNNTRIVNSLVAEDTGKIYLIMLTFVDQINFKVEVAELAPNDQNVKIIKTVTFQDNDALAYMFLPWSMAFSSEKSITLFALPNLKFGGTLNLDNSGWVPLRVSVPNDISIATAFYHEKSINAIASVSGKFAMDEFPQFLLYEFPFSKDK